MRVRRLAVLISALGLVLVACSKTSPGSTGSPSASGSGGTSSVSGNLTLWIDTTIEQTDAYIKDFNKVYPNIKVTYLRSDDAEMYDRFNTQAKTGAVNADVVIIGYDGFSKEWDSKGYLVHYNSPAAAGLPSTALGANGAYYVYANLLEGICYNKDVLAQHNLQPPASWEDLAKPEYKGLEVQQDILKVGSGSNAWTIDMRTYWNNDARWEKFFSAYGKNQVVFEPDYTAAQQQLVQGNFGVQAVCYLDYITPDINKGAPVAWVGVDPVITVGFTVQIPKGVKNTPAAQAFVDYTLSKEGQTALSQDVGQVPARQGVPLPVLAKSADGVPTLAALETPRSADEFKNNIDFYTNKIKGWFNLH